MVNKMKVDDIQKILSELDSASLDIEASAVVSLDGLVIATTLDNAIDEDLVGAMSAAVLSIGERTAQELVRGDLQQVLIKGSTGHVLVTPAGSEAVITVMASASTKLGALFLEVGQTAKEIAKLLN